MIYPGYQLNPGDMFQVEPERVLFATGAEKSKDERLIGRKIKNRKQRESELKQSSEMDDSSTVTFDLTESPLPTDSRIELRSLLDQARDILSTDSTLAAKKKTGLRSFQNLIRRKLSHSKTSTILTDSLDTQFKELISRLDLTPQVSIPQTPAEPGTAENPDSPDDPASPPAPIPTTRTLQREEQAALRAAMAEARENPIDDSKPYATPWRPREWMSAFAFVPRYLEVHHKICSAVYLRHPVARPGLAEVPTPYSGEVNGLAFNWYLRRR